MANRISIATYIFALLWMIASFWPTGWRVRDSRGVYDEAFTRKILLLYVCHRRGDGEDVENLFMTIYQSAKLNLRQ
jgi:hypothetical protein